MENEKIETSKDETQEKSNGVAFLEWLQSLQDWELLDLLMNCGFLLGKTIAPAHEILKKENENENESQTN